MVRKSHCGYGFFLIIGLLLTLVSVFTPGWRSYKDKRDQFEDIFIWNHILGQGAPDLGLISRYCGQGTREVNQYDCKSYGRFQLPFEKTTLAFMIIAIIFEIVSVGCFIGLFSPRARLGMPAFSATGLAFFCLFVAIVIYGVRMQYKVGEFPIKSFGFFKNVF
uniref:Tetraspanin family protein n=1 Tax=Caenorhabditis tropicalis TaxID=1561998 RepID=A0A1I7TG44_9PELO